MKTASGSDRKRRLTGVMGLLLAFALVVVAVMTPVLAFQGMPARSWGSLAVANAATPQGAQSAELDLTGVIDGNGVVQQDIDYSAFDGILRLYIGKGTTVRAKDQKPLRSIVVEKKYTGLPQLQPGAYMVGCAYNLKPDGSSITPLLTMTLQYDPDSIPPGADQGDLVIAYYNVSLGRWVVLATSVMDAEKHTVAAEVSHLSLFAVLAHALVSTGTPTSSPTPMPPGVTPTPVPPGEGGINPWVVICVILAIIVVVLVVYLLVRQRGKKETPKTN